MVTPGSEQECPELISRWVESPISSNTWRARPAIGIDPLDLPAGGRSFQCQRSCLFPRLRDRKSTRLNSSHLVISYAVFCLKKKKKIKHIKVVQVKIST